MRRYIGITIAALISVAACAGEPDEAPEIAEIEAAAPDAALELTADLDLEPTDVGRILMATGRVVGPPIENGFYLRTEENRVIFVAADVGVETDETVRVVGPLLAAEQKMREGWGPEFEAAFSDDWEVETALYIDATTVERSEESPRPGGAPDTTPPLRPRT